MVPINCAYDCTHVRTLQGLKSEWVISTVLIG